jgi:argininosuccinate lyase
LRIFADMMGESANAAGETVPNVRVRPEAMGAALKQGYATATDLADYLVKKGLPFRAAHEAVARAVRAAEQRGCDLADLPLDELRGFSSLVGEDVYAVLTLEGSLQARNHIGGTAPEQVLAAVARVRARLG